MRLHAKRHHPRKTIDTTALVAAGASAAGLAAAGRVTRRASASRRMRRPVMGLMTRDVSSIGPHESIRVAAERLAENETGALPVCLSGGRLLGVVTDRDIALRVVAQGEDAETMTVGDAIAGEPVIVDVEASLGDAMAQMARNRVRRVCVTEHGRLVGVLGQSDVADHAPNGRVAALLRGVAHAPPDEPSARWAFARAHRAPRPTDAGMRAAEREGRALSGTLMTEARAAMSKR